ncbi:MAG TPA: AMP-binding protein [Silvibacterium sp.]|nr:AMP-binding protein [Silvibacterium sp.]
MTHAWVATETAAATANVADFLLAGKPPERIALQFVERNYSYAELATASQGVASFCDQLGLRKGDRVVLISDNSFFWVAVYLGLLRAGLVCVPLPPSLPARVLDYVLHVTEARLAAVQARYAVKNAASFCGMHLMTDSAIESAQSFLSHSDMTDVSRRESSTPFPASEILPGDLAAIMFTSGSTGQPRGVMISHRNITANTESIIESLSLTEQDRTMAVLPFHYCFGTSLLHTHLRVGGSLVVDLRFMYPEVVLQRMQTTQCTGFAGVPSHFQILLRRSKLAQRSFPALRYVQQAGGHLAPPFVRELREALPQTQILLMYGQTEATARLSFLPAQELATRPGSIGKAIPGVTLRVVDDAGSEVPPGHPGEIVAEGENVALGYWRAPQETAATFRHGKLHTGDIATVDSDGFLYIVDRAKDFLKCGGKRISCRQIEDQILECRDLLEVAVVGVRDEVLGEAVGAFVVPRNPQSGDAAAVVHAFCKQHLPPALIPKKIVVLRSLPKNEAGKTLKQCLPSLRGQSI